MLKQELENKLYEEQKKQEKLRRGLNMAIDALKDISLGYGKTKGDKCKAEYLAADILADIAKIVGEPR